MHTYLPALFGNSFTSTPNSDYQVPTPNSSVGTGLFMRDSFVRNNSNFPNGEYKFDYEVDAEMLAIARTIRPKLDQCGPKQPKFVYQVSH
ncbi:MAG: hypothetical protein V7K26_15895 [Nostoc sp.]|uniref:hypothetical protein n=1 Tax=Nostoc sp. TaxID=1180 RepID=UPI002FEFADB2